MKKLFIIGAIAFFGVLATSSVSAAGFGAAPGTIENLYLKPGAVFKQEIVISQSDPTSDISVSVVPDLGDANQWVQFAPGNEFVIPAGQKQYKVEALFEVPSNVQYKPYNGVVRIKAVNNNAEQTNGGVTVAQGITLGVNMNVTSQDFASLIVRAVDIPDIKPSENLSVALKVENNGNIDTTPTRVTLDILDLTQEKLDSLDSNNLESVPAGETKTIYAPFNADLTEGEYFGDIKVYLDDAVLREERVVFTVSEAVSSDDSTTDTVEPAATNSTGTIVLLGAVVLGILIVLIVLMSAARQSTKSTKKSST